MHAPFLHDTPCPPLPLSLPFLQTHLCYSVEDIFAAIENDPEPSATKYLVRASYLQIYNEVSGNCKAALKLPRLGCVVCGGKEGSSTTGVKTLGASTQGAAVSLWQSASALAMVHSSHAGRKGWGKAEIAKKQGGLLSHILSCHDSPKTAGHQRPAQA